VFLVFNLLKSKSKIYIKFTTATKGPTPNGVGSFVVGEDIGFERPVQANSPVDCLPGCGSPSGERIRLIHIHPKMPVFGRRLAIFTSSLLPIHSSLNPTSDFGKVISNSEYIHSANGEISLKFRLIWITMTEIIR